MSCCTLPCTFFCSWRKCPATGELGCKSARCEAGIQCEISVTVVSATESHGCALSSQVELQVSFSPSCWGHQNVCWYFWWPNLIPVYLRPIWPSWIHLVLCFGTYNTVPVPMKDRRLFRPSLERRNRGSCWMRIYIWPCSIQMTNRTWLTEMHFIDCASSAVIITSGVLLSRGCSVEFTIEVRVWWRRLHSFRS